ncbi:MarR family transcriptional regulator [Paraburkholderia nemoris]|uniref:MarR family winged helix-turn-helix transcriptional regulator n=1 Tax=Paraburkholderia nemoris TaxID=2793076 RepID=UPI0038BD69DC
MVQTELSDVLFKKPGHLIRRLQTLATTLYLEAVGSVDATFDQFCVLSAVVVHPKTDQLRIALATGLDRSTVSGVIIRLEAKALISRQEDPADRRAKLLTATREGKKLFATLSAAADNADARLLEALPARQRATFARMLARVVDESDAASRVPVARSEDSKLLAPALYKRPIYQLRRLQQYAVTVFLEATSGYDITPVQFGALVSVLARPGIDQIRLSQIVGFDRNTLSGVLERLEGKGLITREASVADRRAKVLYLTQTGSDLYKTLFDATEAANVRMLPGLSDVERATFLKLIERIVWAHNDLSRAPVDEVAARAIHKPQPASF